MNGGRRVVVTGLGLVSPLGIGSISNWNRILGSKSGISKLDMDTPTKVAGIVRESLSTESRVLSRSMSMGMTATKEALLDANLPNDTTDLENVGVSVGMSMSDLDYIGRNHEYMNRDETHKISPYFVPYILPNLAPGHISIKYGFMGPLHSVSTACATGSHAIGDAFHFIKYGAADVMVAGAVDSCLNALSITGFCRARALSTRFNDCTASRPFDKDRDGFVISEGAGILILESLDHALRRGHSSIYCEVVGYGLSGDADHVTAGRKDGRGAILAMKRALRNFDVKDVAYVNAHATSTPRGDKAEALAIRTIFNDSKIPVTSNKGHIGHLLGAAGAVESAFVAQSFKERTIPGTANVFHIDKDIQDSIQVVCEPRPLPEGRPLVLKNSFGFGGTNMNPEELVSHVRHNQGVLDDFVRDLTSWQKTMESKDKDLLAGTSNEKQLQEAQVEKEKGNQHFKSGNYKEAVECYSKGLKCDPSNAILAANRAMAYLKLNRIEEAEVDCTLAIKLDPNYAKAYARRATARSGLKRFQDAIRDYERVLDLEPKNKVAKTELEKLRRKDIAKREDSKIKDDFKTNIKTAFSSSKPVESELMTISSTKRIIQDPGEISPIYNKPVHLRSKKPMIPMKITEVGDVDTKVKENEISKDLEEKVSITSTTTTTKIKTKKKKLSKPKSSMEFIRIWKDLEDEESRSNYLSLMSCQDYPSVFKHSLEPKTFIEILSVLQRLLSTDQQKVQTHLLGLLKVPRISAIILFLEPKQREVLDEMLEVIKASPSLKKQELESILALFPIN